jgi:hypothetical protein
MSESPPGKPARRPAWLRAWTVAVARMPETGWPTGRWRRIGLSCFGIVLVVVAAGVVAGGVIGVGVLELVRMTVSPDPLVAREVP